MARAGTQLKTGVGSRAKKTAGKGRSAQAQEEVLRTAFTDGASADRSAKAGGAGEGPVENMMMIRADRLMPRADQPRNVFEPEALKELADSIDSLRAAGIGVNGSGILQPLTVRVPGEEERDEGTDVDKFQIIAGERRYRAGQSVGVTVFPCVLEERAGKDAAFEVALRENLQREDLSPLEAAVSINRMMAGQNVLGKPMSELEVSRHIGKHLNWVKDRRAVLRMDEDLQGMVGRRYDTLRSAQEISKLPQNSGLRQELIEEAVNGLSHARVAERVRNEVEVARRHRAPSAGESPYDISPEGINRIVEMGDAGLSRLAQHEEVRAGAPQARQLPLYDVSQSIRDAAAILDRARGSAQRIALTAETRGVYESALREAEKALAGLRELLGSSVAGEGVESRGE